MTAVWVRGVVCSTLNHSDARWDILTFHGTIGRPKLAFFTLFLRGPQLQVPRWKPGSLLRLSRTPPTALRFFRESALFTPSASGGSWSTGTGSSIGSRPHKSTKRACPANCRFQEGDATNLHQVPDQAFDLVVSFFGAMFAPKPFEVAKETVRVTRPGGRITMGSWIPNDPTLVAQTLKISSAYTPPPPEGFVSPMTWGIESNVIERFAGAGVPAEKITFARDTFTFIYPSAPAALLDEFRKYYGPTMNAFEAAERSGRAGDLQKELEELFNQQNQSPRKDATSIPATFLRVTVAL